MKIHRFYNKLAGEKLIDLAGNDARQIIDVLRLKIGEGVIFFNGKDLVDFEYELTDIENKNATFSLKKEAKNTREPEKIIHLYLSILKRNNFELALEKSVELGVTSITPILSERTIKKGVNLERLQKIAQEATEQSGRGVVPKIFEPVRFQAAIKKAVNPIFFEPRGTDAIKLKNEVSIFIGPEGGWTLKELELAKIKGVPVVPLTKTILRAETAAIIATYKILE